jgi:NAD(P)-dependent dehydrogenase (short-subunit alcohol dehydrogenase family)
MLTKELRYLKDIISNKRRTVSFSSVSWLNLVKHFGKLNQMCLMKLIMLVYGEIDSMNIFFLIDFFLFDYSNHYYCSVYAARLMVPRKQGLIIFISSAGGLRYLFNIAYGVGKAAVSYSSYALIFNMRKI